MRFKFHFLFILIVGALSLAGASLNLQAQNRFLSGQVPAVTPGLKPAGGLSGSTNLQLAIGLPLRDTGALSNLLQEICNPGSPLYRHYLTPAEFTARFGPTEADYQKVIQFADAYGLKITATHPNRLLLDVSGSVVNVERAFNVKLLEYQHPTEQRKFYAPDREPSLAADLPVVDVSGLNNYALPKPRWHKASQAKPAVAQPNSGSGPGGSYMGLDFRAAYVPGVTLDGTGQSVGLLQFDGYTAGDIAYYENAAGLPNVPLQNVLLDGFNGTPTGSGGEVEVSLDIEMSISMATNLSSVIVYMAGPAGNWHDILNRMATDDLAKQLSCSWFIPGGTSDPVADGIFQEMAAQGQSFFDASGDHDAYSALIPFAGDSPYITQVGGTTLTTTGPHGAWSSETVWNWGNGIGSGGGISTQYPIPSWQTNAITPASQGSTTMRNTPDVALTADNVEVRADGGYQNVGGTSCAAPLWAGFTALVNQQAAAGGHAPVGFINPLVYTIGAGANYTTVFHDVTTGNNESPGSPTKFTAVTGYDLCTGWGTPNGQAMINALANPEPLIITPISGFASLGGVGGPFSVNSEFFSLTNSGTNIIHWTLTNTSLWLTASTTSGTLPVGSPTFMVKVALNNAASNLVAGTYSTTVWFTNLTDKVGQSRQFTLDVIAPPAITKQPANITVLDGQTAAFAAQVSGGAPLTYQWQFNGANLTDGGNITGSATTNLVISGATPNNAGVYALIATNYTGRVVSSNAQLTIRASLPVITSLSSNQTVYATENAQFSVSAVGTKPFSYQWTYGGTNNFIPGATNSTLVLDDLQVSQSGNYSVWITNIVGATNSGPVVLTVNPIPSCDPISPGMISWWAGEGNALDSFGTNNGTLVNGVTFTNGEVGLAFLFNGNDYVSIPDSASLDTITTNLTVEFWMQSAQTGNNPNWMWMVTKGNDTWRVMGTTGGNGVAFDTTGPSQIDLEGTRVVNDGQWHHIAAVYDGTTKYLYVDGTLDVSTPATGAINLDSQPVELGENSQADSSFSGALDEVSIYHQALTAAQIQEIYLVGLGGKCPLPPTIVTQPASQTNYAGGTATFSVAAKGGQLSYQWSYDTTIIPGATNDTLTLSDVQVGQSGDYSVLVYNRGGSTNSATVLLTVLPVPPCAPVNPGLISWWAGEGNAADDASLNNGTLVNGVTFTPGEVGMAFLFNGSDYVSIPDSASLDTITTNLTVEFWMQSAQAGNNPGWMWLVTKGNTTWRVMGTTGGSTVSFDTTGTSSTDVTGTRVVNDGQWHHVAAVYDGTNKYLYVDGALDASVPCTGAIDLNTQPLELGANSETVSSYAGALDEVSVYNRALTANEIQEIYIEGPNGKCPLPPVIVTQPVSLTNYVGGTATFAVAAAGGQPLNYQWSYGTTVIPGATNDTLTLTDLQLSQSGDYSVLVSNGAGSTNSATVTLTVNPEPPCTPVDYSIISWWAGEGDATDKAGVNNGTLVNGVTFTPGEVGMAFLFNGSDYVSIPDSTSLDTITTNLTVEFWMQSAQTGNNPNWMWMVTKGNDTWRVMGTTGGNGVAFDTTGPSQIDLEGTRVVNDGQWHHIAAVYDGTTKYLYVDGTLDVSTPATGAINLDNQPVELGENSQADSSFSGALDEVTIYNRALTATEIQEIYLEGASGKCPVPLAIVSQPVSQTNYVGNTATLAVGAIGSPPLSFQWSYDAVIIPGATNDTLTLTNLQVSESGNYSVLISNSQGSTNSATAVLTVVPLACTPVNHGIISWWAGEGNALDQAGTNNGTLKSGVTFTNGEVGLAFLFNGSDYVSVPDSASLDTITTKLSVEFWMKSGLTTANPNWMWLVTKGNTSWRVMCTTGAKTVSFDTTGPSQTDLTGTRNVNDGQWHHVAAVYDGTNKFLYVDGTLDVSAATSGGITPNNQPLELAANSQATSSYSGALDEVSIYNQPLTAGQVQQIYLAGRGGKCPLSPPVISSQPASQTVTAGRPATFNVVAAGGLPLHYQWTFNTTNIINATNSSLTLSNVQLTNAGNYAVLVTNIYGSVLSSNAVLTVAVLPYITLQPTNQTVGFGRTATFAVVAAGSTPLTYQWSENATNVPGATNAVLILTNVQFAQSRSVFSVLVTNLFGSVTSSNVVLVVTNRLDHFLWSQIPSPRFVNIPITVTLQAQDVTNQIWTNFNGTVTLSSTNGVPVTPPVTANFVKGQWIGSVTISQLATNLVLAANDGAGDLGLANSINVVQRPALGSTVSGESLLIFWPVGTPTFTLETTENLVAPTKWVPVNQQPAQIGGENLISIPITQATNNYYRLVYTGP